jgi:hypothetical protein
MDLPVPVGPQNIGWKPFINKMFMSLFILTESIVGIIN